MLSNAVQVIVMSGHETIRVLEVEVDQASLPSSVPDGRTDSGGEDGGNQATEQPEAGMQDSPRPPHNAGGVGEPFVGYRYGRLDSMQYRLYCILFTVSA